MRYVTRRELLATLPALALAPRAFAQAKPQIALKGFNHFTLAVSDVKRSLDFYQSLFGMPIQARQGQTIILRIGPGPQFLGLSAAGSNPPRSDDSRGATVPGPAPERPGIGKPESSLPSPRWFRPG